MFGIVVVVALSGLIVNKFVSICQYVLCLEKGDSSIYKVLYTFSMWQNDIFFVF